MPQQKPWVKRAALSRMQENELLQEVYWKEPLLRAVVDYAIQQHNDVGYDRSETYSLLKAYASLFVGWGALDEKFATSPYFDAVMSTIDNLLPSDDMDIYKSWEDMPEERQKAWEEWQVKQHTPEEMRGRGVRTLNEYVTEGIKLQERWHNQTARIKAGELPPGYARNQKGKIILKNPSSENFRKLEEDW